jgi:hypothetical protein
MNCDKNVTNVDKFLIKTKIVKLYIAQVQIIDFHFYEVLNNMHCFRVDVLAIISRVLNEAILTSFH